MSSVWTCIRKRGATGGGVIGYPLERVYQEVAYLGHHVHWTHEELLNLDHAERQRWLQAVSQLESHE